MTSTGEERRRAEKPTPHRRRRYERLEDFRMRRDRLLLVVGIGGVVLVTVINATVGFRDTGVALACLAAFAGFAGAPTVLRIDEQRRENDR